MILNIVSDLATPHNNDLIAALRARSDIRVVAWYALRRHPNLPWKEGLAESSADKYFDTVPETARLVWRALSRPDERFLLVGYSNLAAKVILIAFWIMGRRLYYWTDYPESSGSFRVRLGRRIAYGILRRTAARFFVVGRHARSHFERGGLPAERIVEQSIYIQPRPPLASGEIAAVRKTYGIAPGKVLFVSGSRLTQSKGYDVLVNAVSRLNGEAREKSVFVIVGSGPERGELLRQVESAGMPGIVRFVPWLEPRDYDALIGAADAFIHPARFDAFGGGTLYAMASGVPVIASDGAGSAIERIVSGENGLIYPRENPGRLAADIDALVGNPDLRRRLGRAGRRTAETCSPQHGARKLHDALADAERQAAAARR